MTSGKKCCSTCRFLMTFRGGILLPRCVAPVPMWIKARFPWIDIITEPDEFGDGCLAWLASRARPAKKKRPLGTGADGAAASRGATHRGAGS